MRLMLETGLRAGEVVALQFATSTWPRARSPSAAARAARAAWSRRPRGLTGHRPLPAAAPIAPPGGHRRLWLGDRGKRFSYDALHKTLGERADAAGVVGFHPHMLRHTAAHRWLAAGGSEGGLMAVAGWTRPDMLMRYTKAQASARAAEEARKLNLGEL